MTTTSSLPAALREIDVDRLRELWAWAPPGWGHEALVRTWADAAGMPIRILRPATDPSDPTREQGAQAVAVVAEAPPADGEHGRGRIVLGPTELCLSVDELAAALPVDDAEMAARLHIDTGGIPALALAALGGRLDGSSSSATGLAQVLAATEAQRHLRSWLEGPWWPLVRYLAVAGASSMAEIEAMRSGEAARDLLQTGLASFRPVSGTSCLALVPAVARAVEESMAASPGEIDRVLGFVARLRDRLRVLDHGLEAATRAGDHGLVARILDQHSIQFAFGPRGSGSQRALRHLPADLLAAHPVAGHRAEYLGLIPVGTTSLSLPETVDACRDAIRAGRDRHLLSQSFFAMIARRNFGRQHEARQIAVESTTLALYVMRAEHGVSSGIGALWFLHAGIACHVAGDADGARFYYRTAWRYRDSDELGFVAHDTAAKLAMLTAQGGGAERTRRWIQRAEASPLRADVAPLTAKWAHRGVQLARHAIAVDALDAEAMASTRAGLGDYVDRDEFWPVLLWSQARHLLAEGRPRDVLAVVDDAWRATPFAPRATTLHADLAHAAVAEARLALGHGSEAAASLRHLGDDRPAGRPARARLALLAGDVERARHLAADLAARADTAARDQIELTLLVGVAAHELGDTDAARSAVTDATRRALAAGDRRVFLTVSRQVLLAYAEGLPELATTLAALEREGFEEIYPERVHVVELSPRERVVLREVANEKTTAQIAETLVVSRNTVKSQIRTTFAKLGVSTRHQAVAEARRLGLLDLQGQSGPGSRLRAARPGGDDRPVGSGR